MQQLYPQDMGAHAQQHGLYVLQTAPPISLFHEIYVRGLMPSFGALLRFFGALCAVVTRARGGGGVCYDVDDDFADFDFADFRYESNDVCYEVMDLENAFIQGSHTPIYVHLPRLGDDASITWTCHDSDIWGAKQLAYPETVWRDQIRLAIAHGVGKCYCTGRLRAEGDARLFRGRTRQTESNESNRVKI